MPLPDQPKQGASCCGCWCDMRRAVLIVSAIIFVLRIIGLISYLASADWLTNQIDDDELKEDIEDAYKIQSIFVGIGVAVCLVVIYGAIKYKILPVLFGIIWLVVEFVTDAVLTSQAYSDSDEGFPIIPLIVSLIITGLFIYPHAGFIMEVKSGVMSEETYPREEQSCCCV